MIEKRDLTHGGGWVPAVTHVNPKFNHATVPRLIEGTKYEFRVCAENFQGKSEPLNTDRGVTAKNQFSEYLVLEIYLPRITELFVPFLPQLSNPLNTENIFNYRCAWPTW